MIQQTSRLAYNEVKPELGQKQRVVYVAIQMSKRPVCNQELSDYLKIPINAITPRVQELRQLGKIKLAFKDKYPPTGRLVMYWSVV